MQRVLTWAVILLVVAAGALGLAGWYYSDEVLRVPTASPVERDVPLADVDPERGMVTLAADAGDLVELDLVGLATDTALLKLNGPAHVDADDGLARRRAVLLDGEWPEPGELGGAVLDTFAGKPDAMLGIPLETVSIPGDRGQLPGWRVVPRKTPTDDLWVVVVHSRGSTPTEGNRLQPTLAELRLPSLTVSVRNDPGAYAEPDGFSRFGHTEWRDVQAAVDHLREVEGARRFVLAGFGQGASSSLEFLRRSPDGDDVAAAVLVSPLVSLDAALELRAQTAGVPGPLATPLVHATRWVSQWRADLPRDAAEHLDHLDALPDELPMLLTHGTADRRVPVEASREFAEQLGEQVTYEEYEGVDHLREWNADRDRFEEDLQQFLEEHLPRER